MGEHAVDPDRREQPRHDAEHERQQHRRAARPQRALDPRRQCFDVAEEQLRVDTGDDSPDPLPTDSIASRVVFTTKLMLLVGLWA
jgi:hypothetical protein